MTLLGRAILAVQTADLQALRLEEARDAYREEHRPGAVPTPGAPA